MNPRTSIGQSTIPACALLLAVLSGGCASSPTSSTSGKPVLLYSLHYNAPGENRYPPDGNYSEILKQFSEDFTVRVHAEPLNDRTLADVRLVLIANANAEPVPGNPPPNKVSDADIAALTRFVENGGGLIVMQNQEGHNVEYENMNRLLARFGMQTVEQYTDPKMIAIPGDHPFLGGLRWAYVVGNSVTINASHPARPRAIVANDPGQKLLGGTRDAPGILLAGAEPGKGHVLVVTDCGWIINGVFAGEAAAGVVFPDHDNREIARRLTRWAAGLPSR